MRNTSRREFLQATLAAPTLLADNPQEAAQVSGPRVSRKQNVIWIIADQFRAQALTSSGDPNARTPNLDRAAAFGINFTHNISGYPLCCPFRGSMLTGKYPNKCVPGHEYPLPPGEKTLADTFNANGYHTSYFGKWHLGGFHEADGRAAFFITDPQRRGSFAEWTGYENNNSPWDCWVHGGAGKTAFHSRLHGYESDVLTTMFVAHLAERAAARKPFFAVLSVQAPHDPYVAPAEWMSKYNPEALQLRPNVATIPEVRTRARQDLAGYYAMIENIDWNYGRVIQKLEETELLENTHVLFFSDHGDMHGSHGLFRKTNPYEEAIRTPWILSGGIPRYTPFKTGVSTVLSNHVDIAPTTLGLCGIAKPDWMSGSDLSGYRMDKPGELPTPDSAYLQNIIPTHHPDSVNTPYRGLVSRDGWKYVCFENQSWLLFHLAEDPWEEANLAFDDRFREERKRLIQRLGQWISDTGDRFKLPAN